MYHVRWHSHHRMFRVLTSTGGSHWFTRSDIAIWVETRCERVANIVSQLARTAYRRPDQWQAADTDVPAWAKGELVAA